jgi:hypothetical protein
MQTRERPAHRISHRVRSSVREVEIRRDHRSSFLEQSSVLADSPFVPAAFRSATLSAILSAPSIFSGSLVIFGVIFHGIASLDKKWLAKERLLTGKVANPGTLRVLYITG